MTYDQHSDVIIDIAMVGEKRFVSNSTDQKQILWDIESGDVLKVIEISEDVCMSIYYEKELNLLVFSSLDGMIRAVELDTDMEEVKSKYTLSQEIPIFFCLIIGYKELKFLKLKKEESKPIADQVIPEEEKEYSSPGKVSIARPSAVGDEEKTENSKNSNSDSKLKINKNIDIEQKASGSKQKININGLFDMNKEVLDDPEAEEMLSKGMCYLVCTINQENNNSLILWDLHADKSK
jgi:WD40 repeat protein